MDTSEHAWFEGRGEAEPLWITMIDDYTIRYRSQVLRIERRSIRAGLRKAKIIVEQRLDGSGKLRWQGRCLRYHHVAPRPKTTTTTTRSRETTKDRRPDSFETAALGWYTHGRRGRP